MLPGFFRRLDVALGDVPARLAAGEIVEIGHRLFSESILLVGFGHRLDDPLESAQLVEEEFLFLAPAQVAEALELSGVDELTQRVHRCRRFGLVVFHFERVTAAAGETSPPG